jgi:hypothetical protein
MAGSESAGGRAPVDSPTAGYVREPGWVPPATRCAREGVRSMETTAVLTAEYELSHAGAIEQFPTRSCARSSPGASGSKLSRIFSTTSMPKR